MMFSLNLPAKSNLSSLQGRIATMVSVGIVLLCFPSTLFAKVEPIIKPNVVHHAEYGHKFAISTQHPIASQVAKDILQDGGNAADAAVAVGFALAVVLPRAGNIAGGGFALTYDKKNDKVNALDFREKAPKLGTADMFDHPDAQTASMLSKFTGKAVGVPGTVAGLHQLWLSQGSMDWDELLKPAIRLAKKGFAITWDLHFNLQRATHVQRDKAASKIFYRKGKAKAPGKKLVQKKLAKTLSRIAEAPLQDFYHGETAAMLIDAVQANGGIMSLADLKAYQPKWREPVVGNYRGWKIASMPPPSSGGVHLIQMLKTLESFDVAASGQNTASTLHLLAETMRLAYADRATHLGDSDFYPVPISKLISSSYNNKRAKMIDLAKAGNSENIGTGFPAESRDTTHYSIVDKKGNVVAITYTINFSYGSGIMVPEGGFFLNNEMDDFSKEGVINAYGLVGSYANRVQAEKRPLSSMTPTIAFSPENDVIALGAPGGSRIITSVLQVLSNVIDHGMTLAQATHAPRIHHQWKPDRIFHEAGINSDTLTLLESKGHQLSKVGTIASVMSVRTLAKQGGVLAVADPRRPDGSALTDTSYQIKHR